MLFQIRRRSDEPLGPGDVKRLRRWIKQDHEYEREREARG
jgi:hypothetical protein